MGGCACGSSRARACASGAAATRIQRPATSCWASTPFARTAVGGSAARNEWRPRGVGRLVYVELGEDVVDLGAADEVLAVEYGDRLAVGEDAEVGIRDGGLELA